MDNRNIYYREYFLKRIGGDKVTTALKEKATKLNGGGDFGGQRGDIDKLFDDGIYTMFFTQTKTKRKR
jgi:hypothetical protein